MTKKKKDQDEALDPQNDADTTDDYENESNTVRFRLTSAMAGGNHKMNLKKQGCKLDTRRAYAGTTYEQEYHIIS